MDVHHHERQRTSPRYFDRGSPTAHEGGSAQNACSTARDSNSNSAEAPGAQRIRSAGEKTSHAGHHEGLGRTGRAATTVKLGE